MKSTRKISYIPSVAIGVFFILHYLYFFIFNRYHLANQEQMQVFRFDWGYFAGLLAKPGGLSRYIGFFFTQFYLYRLIGPLIVTLAGIAIYQLSDYIFKKFKIYGALWSLIPVLSVAYLQSDYMYNLGCTIGFLLSLTFVAIYVSVQKDSIRYTAGFFGWFLLYLATGGYSLLAIVLCIIYEVLFTDKSSRWTIAGGYILSAIIFPYLAWRFIYYITFSDAWLNLIIISFDGIIKYGIILSLIYYPLLILGVKIGLTLSKKEIFTFRWNWKTMLAGIMVCITMALLIKYKAYDYRYELFFGIDINIQQEKWDEALKLSRKYPENHLLILYLTNIALYKSGQLGDQLFHYPQAGPSGLYLEWEDNDVKPLYGSEIFYHLGHITEAYRWAFVAMIINGPSPRLLKRLVLTSLILGNNEITEKNLNILNQTLFYRKWAQHYFSYLKNPDLINQDKEILIKRYLLINKDFIVGEDNTVLGLTKLLENHPDNRMAFEYYMASLLLSKDILTFIKNIDRIKDFGYINIPVHYEEALLWYMGYSKTNVIPSGYTIRESTIKNFQDYSHAYSYLYANNPRMMATELSKSFGNTFWYYYHFYSTQESSKAGIRGKGYW